MFIDSKFTCIFSMIDHNLSHYDGRLPPLPMLEENPAPIPPLTS